ncbi:MAG: hypothetical protein NTZ95_04535, partial [Candidatus Omnitrophica bacterium]|nr:hypothetical protein [Candidatus Omnitrophota bacterium]
MRLLEKAQELQKGKEPVLALATTKEIVKAAIARLRIINTQPGEPIATTGPMPVAPEVVTGPVVAAPTTKVHTPLVTVETAAPVVEKAESRGKSIREVLEAQKPKTEAGAESIIMGLEDFGVIKDFLEFSIKKLKERGVLVESANAIYLLGWVLAEKGVPGARIGAIVQGICFSADPKESALKLIPEPSEKTGTMLDRYLNFLKSCTNERDMNIGPTVRIFLNLPDSYRGVLTEEEIGTALKLDLYLSSYSMSDTVPLDKKIRDEYLVNPSFTKLRSRLAEGAYDSQEVRAASAKDLVRAFLLNNRECIFWHSRNTIKAYEGKKYRSIDGVDYEVVPSKMHEWSDSPVKDEITRFMFTQMETLEKMAGSGEFARLLKESGFLTHTISGVQYIIPISTSQLLSGYRGQIVGDNSGARHLTPSLPLAIFYRSASRSAVDGKALPGDRDKSAVHEFDIALLILTGRGDRKVDDGETMAYKLTGKPLPDFARKRMLAIKDDDIVD